MDLTEKQSIAKCKELWNNIETSGLSKNEYFNQHPDLKFQFSCNCPLCDWVDEGEWQDDGDESPFPCPNTKRVCPLLKQYHKTCYDLGFADENGIELSSIIPSKKFLDIIKNLK
jgi:hypothetical protein